MPQTTLTLGEITFANFEVPTSMPFGGTQMLTIHRLVGGGRQIDALGADPEPISWSGWFTDVNGRDRARYLDRMRKAGQRLHLAWDEFAFTVVIREAKFVYRLANRIQYSITCEVVEDLTAVVQILPVDDADAIIAADLNTAATLAEGTGDAELIAMVANLQASVNDLGGLASASRGSVLALATPIADTKGQVAALRAACTAQIAGMTGVAGVVAGGDPAKMAANLIATATAAAESFDLFQLSTTLGRMGSNIQAINSGSTSITAAAPNLFSIAAQQYGDASKWTAIAQANGLTDPQVPGIATLAIPATAVDTGGVLNA